MQRTTHFQTILAKAMAEKGLKAADVVRLTGIPKGAISYYINGRSTPNPARLQLLCEALGIEVTTEEADTWSRKPGHSHSRLFNIWRGMKQRCYYPSHQSYPHYGGRGITICDEWRQSFLAFRGWALANGYQEHLTLDRIDPDGCYCPSNCRWATYQEQTLNKRRPS